MPKLKNQKRKVDDDTEEAEFESLNIDFQEDKDIYIIHIKHLTPEIRTKCYQYVVSQKIDEVYFEFRTILLSDINREKSGYFYLPQELAFIEFDDVIDNIKKLIAFLDKEKIEIQNTRFTFKSNISDKTGIGASDIVQVLCLLTRKTLTVIYFDHQYSTITNNYSLI